MRTQLLLLFALLLVLAPVVAARPGAGPGIPRGVAAPHRASTGVQLNAPTPLPPLPAEARVPTVTGQKQKFSLSCEARAAANWAGFFGVTLDEETFVSQLPVSDNPDFGFVGDLNGPWGKIPPDGYGVHAGPVATLLRLYGINAYAHRRLSWEAVQRQIARGQPVIVWVVGHVERGQAEKYVTPKGLTVVVARYEHTVLVTGYTPTQVEILDGQKTYTRTVAVFLESWGVLGNQAIVRGLLPK